ncbi:hypothetical protein [Aureimonas sp. AU40]|uniref:hypothetical protein n=1 Tax=Aureimonas sp. AU40 TaxID=1637747 RepID=UPI0007867872|nr:hypothetical protein [Aureimonas sp. AU40]
MSHQIVEDDSLQWPSFAEELGRKALDAIQNLMRRHKDGEITRDELKVAAGAIYDTMSGLARREDTEILSAVYNKLAGTDKKRS